MTASFENPISLEAPPDFEDKGVQDPPKQLRDVTKGILLALFGAGAMYGLTGVFVRLAGENNVGSAETLFVRSAVQVSCIQICSDYY